MNVELACVACSIDPQVTSLVVPMAQATLISVPFLLRGRIVAAVRRARGRDTMAPEPARPQGCDTRADDPADGGPQPPGALRA